MQTLKELIKCLLCNEKDSLCHTVVPYSNKFHDDRKIPTSFWQFPMKKNLTILQIHFALPAFP